MAPCPAILEDVDPGRTARFIDVASDGASPAEEILSRFLEVPPKAAAGDAEADVGTVAITAATDGTCATTGVPTEVLDIPPKDPARSPNKSGSRSFPKQQRSAPQERGLRAFFIFWGVRWRRKEWAA